MAPDPEAEFRCLTTSSTEINCSMVRKESSPPGGGGATADATIFSGFAHKHRRKRPI